uniref:Uncharacterized protein n=1 Tax=Romanomermis culicivorax TaxID=13658 RepID=A0A915HXU2_ROMCU
MPQFFVNFVGEHGTADRFTAASGTSWITALYHKIGDYAVENRTIIIAASSQFGEIAALPYSRCPQGRKFR